MAEIVIRLIKRVLSFLSRISLNFKIWLIKTDSNIVIGNNLQIKASTKIECRYGGKINIGNNNELLDNVLIFSYGGEISIGDNCSINPGTIIYGHGNTNIGNNVLIAGGCMIIPANHIYARKDILINEQGIERRQINIKDNVWIGHACSILAGVTIGEGSIIAAGSVVNKDVEPFSIAGGVPAKTIGMR